MKSLPLTLKIFLFAGILVVGFSSAMVFSLTKPKARAQTGIPIGGFFTAGTYDIFTTIPYCGLEVNVVGPNPGAFIFMPLLGVYEYFADTPEHISDNTIALGEPGSPCGLPTMVMLGSSLAPGVE